MAFTECRWAITFLDGRAEPVEDNLQPGLKQLYLSSLFLLFSFLFSFIPLFFFISMNVVVVFFHLFIYKLGKKIGYLSRLVSFFFLNI